MSINIHNKEKKVYLVFGTPHSATSFVSKALNDAGVDMNITNDLFHESRDVNAVDDKIIKKAGGKWYRPPTEEEILAVEGCDEDIKKVVSKNKSKFWGVKSPRLALTAKKWLPHLDDDVYLIACFRKPDRVEKSWDKSIHNVDRKVIDKYNRSMISIIKEFCKL